MGIKLLRHIITPKVAGRPLDNPPVKPIREVAYFELEINGEVVAIVSQQDLDDLFMELANIANTEI